MSIGPGFWSLKPPSSSQNNLTSSLTQLPANLLEAFIPGYSIVSRFLLEALGFDVTLVVSTCLLVFGLYKGVNFIWSHAYAQFRTYFMSFISVDSDDEIYKHVMIWLQGQNIVKNSRTLVAKTAQQNVWDLQDLDDEDESSDTTGLLNFSNRDAKVPLEFQPYYGVHRFFYRSRYFEFSRATKEVMHQAWGGSFFQTDEIIKLTCIGRSAQPIKDLLADCRDQYLSGRKASTAVRRPATKEDRQRGRNAWTMVAIRPSRPIHTVVLDNTQKDNILADINEYLHSSTPKWYANRGIPYRRGYLFAGPPGTGKSSLAWAIAGVFGLDIYCISLVEPSLTEEVLGILFTSLPRRCVVLLEDIDSAGMIKRQQSESADTGKKQSGAEPTGADIGAEIAKAIQSAQKANHGAKTRNGDSNNEGISLSGLLNAIDGVASHEGRVLIMTTNCPEALDDALIRPGRIDMRIDFTLATCDQICELFTRMYSPDDAAYLSPKSPAVEPAAASSPNSHPKAHPKAWQSDGKLDGAGMPSPPQTPRENTISRTASLSPPDVEDLSSIATQFSKKIPDGVFSPAEIQGFLLTRKKEPLRALAEVDAWKDRHLEAKSAKKNVGSPAA